MFVNIVQCLDTIFPCKKRHQHTVQSFPLFSITSLLRRALIASSHTAWRAFTQHPFYKVLRVRSLAPECKNSPIALNRAIFPPSRKCSKSPSRSEKLSCASGKPVSGRILCSPEELRVTKFSSEYGRHVIVVMYSRCTRVLSPKNHLLFPESFSLIVILLQ